MPMAVRFAAARVCGAEPSPQLTTTEPPPVVKSATVAAWLASVKVPSSDGAGRDPLDAGDLGAIGAGKRGVEDGDPAAGRAGQRGGRAARGRDDDAEGVGRARRGFLGVGVAAENLEDRVARICRLVSGVTPICWTTSVTPATVGVPSPQPPMARVALTSATVASVLGSVNVASTNRPVFWPSTAVKFLVAPVTGEVGDGGRAGDRRPASRRRRGR